MFPKRRAPTHPGKILEMEFLIPTGVTVKQFAERLGKDWNELKLNAIIKGYEGMSDKACEEFAAQLGTSAEIWRRINQQHREWEKLHLLKKAE